MNKPAFSDYLKKKITHTARPLRSYSDKSRVDFFDGLHGDYGKEQMVDRFLNQFLKRKKSEDDVTDFLSNLNKEVQDSKMRAILLLSLCHSEVVDEVCFFNRLFPVLLVVFFEQDEFFQIAILRAVSKKLKEVPLNEENKKKLKSFCLDRDKLVDLFDMKRSRGQILYGYVSRLAFDSGIEREFLDCFKRFK